MSFFSRKPSDLAEAISEAFQDAPEAWKHSYGQVTHKNGFTVHVGGGERGFRITFAGGAEVLRMSRADRRLIWSAYQEWLNDHLYSLVSK